LVLFSCFMFGREICYQNIYSIGHMICELVTLKEKSFLGFKMFTLPSPQHLLSFPTLPQSHPGENLWRSVFKNVLLQQYYLDHNRWLIFVFSRYLPSWHTGWWLMWTKYSKDGEFRGKRYTPVLCWVSNNIKGHLQKPFYGQQVYFAGCRLKFNYNWKTTGTKNN